MLDGKKIIFVAIVDNNNNSIDGLGIQIWHYRKLIKGLLNTNTCVMGKHTYDITQWKGPNTWILSRDKKLRLTRVGVIHSIDDFHLFMDGPIYVLGGNSLYHQLEPYMDEVHLYVLNNTKGKLPWISLNMNNMRPTNYISKGIWSYAQMEKVKKGEVHMNNDDIFIR